MKKKFNKIISLAKKDIRSHKIYYFLVFFLLICAFLLRIWRIDQLLGFYYDQGRDALIIDALLHGKFTLIGPTTGINGAFLGPFYYYFLSIGYLIGRGDPVIASYYQSFFVTLGLFITFLICRIFFSLRAGLIALFLMTFSFSQIKIDRWLSNPTISVFMTPLVIFLLSLSFKNPVLLPLATLFLGVLLQLEASSGVVITVLIITFILLHRKRFTLISVAFSALTFFATLLPQIFFELKHNFIISKLLLGFVHGNVQTEEHASFRLPTAVTFSNRQDLYATTFLEKLKLNFDPHFSILFTVFLILSVIFVKKNWAKPAVRILAFWFYGILLFFLFYSGNYGVINSYYFVTVFPVFFIFISLILDWSLKLKIFKIIVPLVLIAFLFNQLPMDLSYLSSGVDGETTISLGSQAGAVKYVITNSDGNEYNWDAYVPPVIPYTYTYLFKYYGNINHKNPSDKQVSLLYTIHEVDTVYPDRESAWLKRQDGIGKILDTVRFGGVTVEKRTRI